MYLRSSSGQERSPLRLLSSLLQKSRAVVSCLENRLASLAVQPHHQAQPASGSAPLGCRSPSGQKGKVKTVRNIYSAEQIVLIILQGRKNSISFHLRAAGLAGAVYSLMPGKNWENHHTRTNIFIMWRSLEPFRIPAHKRCISIFILTISPSWVA